MGRLSQEQLVAEVQGRMGRAKPSVAVVHMAITGAYESGSDIEPPNSKLFHKLRELEDAGMLTRYHITKTIELHIEARAEKDAVFDRGCRLFTESPHLAPAIAR